LLGDLGDRAPAVGDGWTGLDEVPEEALQVFRQYLARRLQSYFLGH
jgi:hypothetical protein